MASKLTPLLANLVPKYPSPKQFANSPLPENTVLKVQRYYAEASEGYHDWSKAWNMHFGLYERGCNPFKLEAMLENTNRFVLDQLALTGKENRLLDMGCGLGATARYAAYQNNVAEIYGVTIASNQVKEARAISAEHPNRSKLHFMHADYHRTPFASERFDGIYAIESACHSDETNKHHLLSEAFRLLKPGARLAICDGFIKTEAPMNPISRHCYDQTCANWALGHFANLPQLTRTLDALGFKNILVKDLSWRVLPSAMYIPWMVIKYGAKLLWRRDTKPQHWQHLFAPLWGLGLACNRKQFGYFLVSATKPEQQDQ